MSRVVQPGLVAVALSLQWFANGYSAEETAGQSKNDASALDLFNQRIMPIFRSSEPSSCVQCHLSYVDLKDYILPSHEQTFVSLRDQGLIDLDQPQKSKILKLIRMGDKDLDEGARLIHEETRNAEYEAFTAWINACCNDSRLRELPISSAVALARPKQQDAVIRHARKSRVLDSFVRNVWSQRMRCFPCHTPGELDEENPQHKVQIKKHTEYVQQFGKRMNIFLETPEATLNYLVKRSRLAPKGQLPMLDLEDPAKSLLVMKPTSKVPPKGEDGRPQRPSNAEPTSHMGGLKMHANDQSYKSFVTWIQDYANVVGGRYTSVGDLPADNWHPSKLVVRLNDTPEAWTPLSTVVQLFVYGWNEEKSQWDEEPIAFTQGTVAPRKLVFGALFLLGPTESRSGYGSVDHAVETLAPGRYLVKAYADLEHRLAEDPTMMLGPDEYYGQVEIDAAWKEGFKDAQVVPGDQLKK